MKTKKSPVIETISRKVYFGPTPLKSGSSFETIMKDLVVGMIFERKDNSKIIITEMDNTSFRYKELNFFGKIKEDSTRSFGKETFAKLMVAKYFEPSNIARRESYGELKGRLRLDKCFR